VSRDSDDGPSDPDAADEPAPGKDSRVDMTTGAITPKLVSLAWPLVAGNLLQTAYNLADMFWVGRVGPDAVAAVSLMFPTSWLFVSVAMGITAAAVALVSQHVGAGEDRAADNVVAQTILLALAVAFALATFGYLVREPLVWAIGARGGVYTAALAYIEVIFLSIPFTFLFFAFRACLRAAGDTKTAMWLVVVSAGLNVVLDPFFVLGFQDNVLFSTVGLGGLEAWLYSLTGFAGAGTRGAAIATLIARVLAAVVGVYILLDGSWGVRLHPGDLRPDLPVLKRLVDIGYPATFDGLLRSLAAVAMAALVARFGAVATAAYGIGIRLMSVSWTVSGAVGQATATGVGQNLGAETPDRAETVTWTATGGTMGLLFGVGALAYVFPATLMRVFIGDAAVVDAGVELLRIIAPFWAFFGGLMVIQGGFRGAGDTKVAMVLSLLSRWVFRIPVAWALAYQLTFAELGLWWAMSVSAVASFAVGVVWFRLGTWRESVVGGGGGGVDDDADTATA
jgi:putative MATE family efflux protein